MIDIVFPLGGGSIWDDREIRYSLRSIEKHLTGYRDIYLVGRLPQFLQGVRHISYGDEHHCKETNIYEKVLRACQEPSISDDFLFFNDDHFLLKDVEAINFPFYFKGDLRATSRGLRPGTYRRCIENTYKALNEKNLPTKNFDSHCPIVYNKQFFLDEMPRYDWTGKTTYILKSLYADTKQIEGERRTDCKIGSQHTVAGVMEIIRSKDVFSMGNGGVGPNLLAVLDQLYPNPSRWEK